MKLLRAAFVVLLLTAVVLLPLACRTPNAQTAAFKTTYTLQKITVAAYDAYLDGVIQGRIPTNAVPQVSDAFDQFQIATRLVLDATQYSTNSLAPEHLTTLSANLILLIDSFAKEAQP